MGSKKSRVSKDEEKQYRDLSQELDRNTLGKNKFERDPNDFFMQSLRQRISEEITLKTKKRLLFWSRFAKAEAAIIALLLGGQALTLHQSALCQKEINTLMQSNARMEASIQSFEKNINRLYLKSHTEEHDTNGLNKDRKAHLDSVSESGITKE
ncbi:MAG: hypothetical protein Q8Q33_09005 [Chlamydiota bacterium]|nr:hypothetical protein [Chlamydiota bacterium]